MKFNTTILFLLFSFSLSAQTSSTWTATKEIIPKNELTPRSFQLSIRAGIWGAGVAVEKRIAVDQIIYAELWHGFHVLRTNSPQQFTSGIPPSLVGPPFEGSDPYWWSHQASIGYRYLFYKKSALAYETLPFSNTYAYLGTYFRYTSRQTNEPASNDELGRVNPTYKFGVYLGYQQEISKDGRLVFDSNVGIGAVRNFNFTFGVLEPVLNAKLGFNLFRTKS